MCKLISYLYYPMKTLLLCISLLCVGLVSAQTSEIDSLMNRSFEGLPEANTLKNKFEFLNLNSIAGCKIIYMYAERLQVTEQEKKAIEKRIQHIAKMFYDEGTYLLIKQSGGYAPVFGIKPDTINNKEVMVLLMGGDCTVTKQDEREAVLYGLFNDTMKALLEEE